MLNNAVLWDLGVMVPFYFSPFLFYPESVVVSLFSRCRCRGIQISSDSAENLRLGVCVNECVCLYYVGNVMLHSHTLLLATPSEEIPLKINKDD